MQLVCKIKMTYNTAGKGSIPKFCKMELYLQMTQTNQIHLASSGKLNDMP